MLYTARCRFLYVVWPTSYSQHERIHNECFTQSVCSLRWQTVPNTLKRGRAYHTGQNNRDQKSFSWLRVSCFKKLCFWWVVFETRNSESRDGFLVSVVLPRVMSVLATKLVNQIRHRWLEQSQFGTSCDAHQAVTAATGSDSTQFNILGFCRLQACMAPSVLAVQKPATHWVRDVFSALQDVELWTNIVLQCHARVHNRHYFVSQAPHVACISMW